MSDIAFFDTENITPTRKKDDVKVKVLKILFIVLFLLLFVEVCTYFFIVPCLGNINFLFSGLNSYSEKDLVDFCGESLAKNFIKFNEVEVCSKISSLAGVENVELKKVFPDKVYINVTERKPVAMTFINTEKKTVPVQIDKKGVLFPVRSSSSINTSVPIISGIPVENIPEGMRLPSKYSVLIDQIVSIRQENPECFEAVSEIHVVPREYGNFEIVLFPVQSKLKVVSDRVLDEKTLQKMLLTLDVVSNIESKGNVDLIDLRYGTISYHYSTVKTEDSLE